MIRDEHAVPNAMQGHRRRPYGSHMVPPVVLEQHDAYVIVVVIVEKLNVYVRVELPINKKPILDTFLYKDNGDTTTNTGDKDRDKSKQSKRQERSFLEHALFP